MAAKRRARNPLHTGEEAYNYFLTVIFPDKPMQILDYNRVVADLNGLSRDAFLARVKENTMMMEKTNHQVKPVRRGQFGMYLKGQWFRLRMRPKLPGTGLVERLDVSLLTQNLLAPILGIQNPRCNKRIDFVGGIHGLGELEKRINHGEMMVAFALHPTSMEDLMEVTDAGEIMPPKTTWFEPKLAEGIISYLI